MVTHDPAVARRADRIVWLRDGQIAEPGLQSEPDPAAATGAPP